MKNKITINTETDTETHKVVPISLSIEAARLVQPLINISNKEAEYEFLSVEELCQLYKAMIAAAPEFDGEKHA